ncbi:MAG: alpha-hydroxy-acid oxidizing protein [Phycisphaeraceae bacterium]|nr:alpha-hydroxy-acid oxidizing protein [Phycisphaeraceae bacterium]
MTAVTAHHDLEGLLSLRDFEQVAQETLDPVAWDYFRSGAWDETTLRANEAAWGALRLRHRVLVDVSTRSTASTLLGINASMPVWIAPTAMHRLCTDEGECDTARAARDEGVPMVLSSLATRSVEEVSAAARGSGSGPAGDLLMQIYVSADRGFTRALVARCEAAGVRGFVLTVDTPVWGVRERDVRNGFRVPDGLRMANLERPGGPTGHTGRGIGECLGWTIDAALSWSDLEALCGWTSLPVLVKGLCRGDDARQALECGAKGVIVSNHGGRQLDGAPPTAESLPEVVGAVERKAAVLVDGGIRRGVDVIRALALGADAVLLGRPILWGLAAGAERGVRRVLELMRRELDLAMALCGCPGLDAISRDLVSRGD